MEMITCKKTILQMHVSSGSSEVYLDIFTHSRHCKTPQDRFDTGNTFDTENTFDTLNIFDTEENSETLGNDYHGEAAHTRLAGSWLAGGG